MRLSRFEPKRARIELIPMIDTMVFLLVFFMIASLAMTRQKGLSVNLPAAQSGRDPEYADRTVVVTIRADGGIYLNKTPLARRDLPAALAAYLRRDPKVVVVINADARVRHGEVIAAMDAAKQAGAAYMAIATKPDESASLVASPSLR